MSCWQGRLLHLQFVMSLSTFPPKNGMRSEPAPTATLRPESGHAVVLAMTPLPQQQRREGSRPQLHHREVMTTMVSSSLDSRMCPGLQTMFRLAASSRSVTGCCRFSTTTSRITTLTSGIRFLTTAPGTFMHQDGLAQIITPVQRRISGRL